MAEYRIPEFLKPEYHRESEYADALTEYEEKIGAPWFTEGLNYTEEEFIQIFKICVKENRTFYDVIGYDPKYDDEDDII